MFKFDNDLYFTTKALFHKLQETNLITLNVKDIRMPTYKKNDKEMIMPTLPFMRSFVNMMIYIARLNHLQDYNRELET